MSLSETVFSLGRRAMKSEVWSSGCSCMWIAAELAPGAFRARAAHREPFGFSQAKAFDRDDMAATSYIMFLAFKFIIPSRSFGFLGDLIVG